MKMKNSQYLCVLYVATAGLQGNALGSDEQEVVLLIYVIIDVNSNKVIGVQQYVVKPTVADINENVLSEQLVSETALTEELVKSSGAPLQTAIKQFDSYVRSLQIEPNSPAFRLVADGQLPLRQCLHPEACNKEIELPEYYNAFHDLRKDFRKFYNVPDTEELSSISDLINYLAMNHVTDSEFYVKEAKDMVNLVQRLIADGHCFSSPEIIEIKLEPGICSKDEEIDNNCVVKARGLPWQSSDQDIAKFFRGLNMAKGGVALCLSAQGRRNGEALVRFMNQEQRDMALKRHKHHIGNRYIEVYKATGEDFINVAGGRTTEAEIFLTQGAEVIIRMRGLPYDCTASQIISFFESGPEDKACHVMNGEEGVLFVKKPDKKATGDAFVLFAAEADSPKALSKHRQLIGIRYIELFRSTPAEVQQVLNRSLDSKFYENKNNPPLMTQAPPPVPLVPQFVITAGSRKDCIRLRGLPYEASVENILEFLGDLSKNIVFQGVHMVYNAQGQPSGEAFIQMDSEASAFQAAQGRHHRYMIYGKKQRYIEVFQCSGDDMNLVSTGGLPSTSAASPVAKALISPGMLSSSGSSPTQSVFTQPPPTIQNHWDPLVNGHLLSSLQVQTAMQQNAIIRPPQPDLWMMNPTLQHLAASQMNLALSKQNWVDLSGSAATPTLLPPVPSLPALPSPNVASSAPTTNIASSSIATSPTTSVVSSPAIMPSPQPPAYLPNPFPSAQPLYLYVPPRIPPSHFQPELPPPSVGSTLPSAYALTSNPLMPATQVSQLMGVKRSWDQAFPAAQNPLSPQGNAIKRPYTYPAVSNATALYSVPPPGQATVGFQTTQFFHATI